MWTYHSVLLDFRLSRVLALELSLEESTATALGRPNCRDILVPVDAKVAASIGMALSSLLR